MVNRCWVGLLLTFLEVVLYKCPFALHYTNNINMLILEGLASYGIESSYSEECTVTFIEFLCCVQLSGLVYKNDILMMQSWLRVPKPVGSLADSTIGRLLYTPSPPDMHKPMGATLEIQRALYMEQMEQQLMQSRVAAFHHQPTNVSRFGILKTCKMHVDVGSMLYLSKGGSNRFSINIFHDLLISNSSA